MKKILALALAAVMVLSMAACGKETPANTVPTIPVANGNTGNDNTADATNPTGVTDPIVETDPIEGTGEEDVTMPPLVEGDEETLKIMNTIWALYTDPMTTPYVMGGSVNEEYVAAGEGVPGVYDAAMLADLQGILYIPEAEIANIDEAATAMHAMMANNFTAGVVHVTADATAFANTMVDTLKNNQWICGQPETLIVAVINNEYVLIGFGVTDIMEGFNTNVTTAYADAQIVFNGSLV